MRSRDRAPLLTPLELPRCLRKTLRLAIFLVAWLILAAPPASAVEEDAQDAADQEDQESSLEVRDRLAMEKSLRQARRELAAAARRVQEIQTQLMALKSVDDVRRYRERLPREGRARIGVVVDTEGTVPPGVPGATIVAVTPGSAAEEAGLRPGDVIHAINGMVLAELAAELGGEASDLPAAALVHAAGRLRPGEKVVLDYGRAGQSRQVTLHARIAQDAPVWITPQGEVPAIALEHWPYALLEYEAGQDEQTKKWLDLEMVPLNPDLGRYFGSRSGILVIRAPEGGPLNVKPGDVIVKVGQEQPSTPWQVLRTLRTFQPGELVNLELIRNGNVIVVKAEAPVIRSVFAPRKLTKED